MKMRLDLLAWTAAAAMAAMPATALAAVDSFIWFDGEQGSATDGNHKGWFEIKDVSFGGENPTSIGSASSGAGAGKVRLHEFSIQRVSDSASPKFRQALTSGRHFKTVKIEMRKAGGDPHQYVNYVFTDVLVSKMNISGAGDRGPEESITFAYGAMTVHYNNQASGSGGQMAPQTAPAPTKIFSPQQGRNPQPSR